MRVRTKASSFAHWRKLLRKSGLTVWYDETTLKVGDSLRRAIDQALAQSQFGVVVLSHSFFSKEWPRQELNGWVWPSQTKSGHWEQSTPKKRHCKAIKDSKVRPFVIYSARHTFLTRLGESGCDAWTLARIAGHSNISVSMRYVHPSESAVTNAMHQLSGHNSGHSNKLLPPAESEAMPVTAESEQVDWWAVQDSNLRPPACK